MPQSAAVVSPCVKICSVDPILRVCVGCERTLEEIGGWTRYSAAERETIMAELPGRRTVRMRSASAQQQQQ